MARTTSILESMKAAKPLGPLSSRASSIMAVIKAIMVVIKAIMTTKNQFKCNKGIKAIKVLNRGPGAAAAALLSQRWGGVVGLRGRERETRRTRERLGGSAVHCPGRRPKKRERKI